MDHKEFIIMICFLVPVIVLGLAFSGTSFARWKIIRVIRIPDSDTIRVRMNQVTPDGTILREVTARGSSDTWWFEDEWGNARTPCPDSVSSMMEKVWIKEINSIKDE